MADTRLSELLDQKNLLERNIASAIKRGHNEREQELRDQLAQVCSQIDTLTVDEARTQAQREFLG